MKFILAPDSFKESMTAKEACISMENGIRKVFNDATCIHVPMADGGEGTVDALIESTNGNIYEVEVTAPLGNKVKAKFGILGDGKTAVIEMAEASGIHLVKLEDRNPLLTTTFGTGELIKHALDMNVERIIIGLGGSATNDGGVGMLQALGASFKGSDGKEIALGGGALKDLCEIDLSGFDKRVYDVKIEVACDVKNPLTGEKGASFVFGAQKGGNKETLEVLDSNLKHYAEVVKRDMGKEIDKVEGAGAAGGLGAALIGFCNGKLESGIDLVIKYSNLEEKVRNADFVFTGEGSIDFQTKFGKTPIGVAKVAKKYNIPVIAFGGRIGEGIDELYSLGIDSVIGITPGVISLDEALAKGKDNLEISAENVVRILEIRKV